MPLVISKENIGSADGSAILIKYTGISEADTTPAPFEVIEWADRSVQVNGTFNAGTLTIEGSNDGVNFYALTDPQANALAFTAAKIEQISEITRYVRPRVTAGTGVDLNVTIALRRASSMRA